jgi:aminoglycoside phosphotransferase
MALDALPTELHDLVGDTEIHQITVGRSGARVLRAVRPGGDWIVKVAPGATELEPTLADEVARLQWLARYLPVPAVVAHGTDGSREWLVTMALAGSDATHPEHQGDLDRLIRTLAVGLRRIHDTAPVESCPFVASTDALLDLAERRVRAGLVDHTDFDAIYQGLTPRQLFHNLVSLRPDAPHDPVVTHGDYCVPNVILDRGTVSGYVDLGRAGAGDRYRDLAVAARSIAHNFGGHAVGPFFDAYGIDWPDVRRVEFFVMLDELS